MTPGRVVIAAALVLGVAAPESSSAPAPPTAAQLLAKVKTCRQISHGRYRSDSGGSATVAVCGAPGAVFWRADMDIDCDGIGTAHCNRSADPSYLPSTALEPGGKPLNAETTPYVVLPQPGPVFDYRTRHLKLGGVAAIVFKGKLVYAVVGDVGPVDIVGEASYAASKRLGIDPDPATGGAPAGVTYLVFPDTRVADPRSPASIAKAGQAAAAKFLARP